MYVIFSSAGIIAVLTATLRRATALGLPSSFRFLFFLRRCMEGNGHAKETEGKKTDVTGASWNQMETLLYRLPKTKITTSRIEELLHAASQKLVPESRLVTVGQ